MKRLLVLLGWAAGAAGVIMMILGIAARMVGGILWNHWWSNYFYPGAVFIILGIFFFMGALLCDGLSKGEK
mgnify:FL=1